MNVWVIGSGGWGTALAVLLHTNGHAVTLWSHSKEKADMLQVKRENPLLDGVEIPEKITVTADISALREAQMAVFAAPSFALREVARTAAPHLADGTVLVSVTKGIEWDTHYRMSQIIAEETGHRFAVAVLSGPSHAEEVARRQPTGCVAAAEEESVAVQVQKAFGNNYFRVYTHDDVVGVELAGALKTLRRSAAA